MPFRDGTDTRWMTENQLEQAYQGRSTRQADDRAALHALIDDLQPEIDLDGKGRVAVSARPATATPPISGQPSGGDSAAMVLEGLDSSTEIAGPRTTSGGVLSGLNRDAIYNPRTGLRRWVIRSNHHTTNPGDRADWATIELRHDGALALAVGLTDLVPVDSIVDVVPTGSSTV